MPSIPVSISSDVIPEMYEYERAETTVVNSYIRPVVSKYIESLESELSRTMKGIKLHILRSDGGLSTALSAAASPVNLLMSGPAGGVAGAVGIAKRAGFNKLLTFDMGGTSTDVALIENGTPQTRRETRVGDVTVRAPSIDVRTVGAGGGSIAYVPELTRALRVGPQSAGAVPGPAAYGKGGEAPTVTDANVVLGYLPSDSKLGGDMTIDREPAEKAVAKIADALGHEARKGCRRHRQYRQREHVRRAPARLGRARIRPARLCADRLRRRRAVARQRACEADQQLAGHCAARAGRALRLRRCDHTLAQRGVAHAGAAVRNLSDPQIRAILADLESDAAKALAAEGVESAGQETLYQIDMRYAGQGMKLTVDTTPADFRADGLAGVAKRFDRMHEQLFTFALDAGHELVGLRAVVLGPQKPFIGGRPAARRFRSRRRQRCSGRGSLSATAGARRRSTIAPN